MTARTDSEAPARGTRTTLLWIGACVLSGAATFALVLADDVRLLRVGTIAALWATLLAALRAGRLREWVRERDELLNRRQIDYERELEREIAARREHEAETEQEIRRRVEERDNAELTELRSEVHELRRLLERRGGTPSARGDERFRPEGERLGAAERPVGAASVESASPVAGESSAGTPPRQTTTGGPVPAPSGGAESAPAAPVTPPRPVRQPQGLPPQRPPRFVGALSGTVPGSAERAKSPESPSRPSPEGGRTPPPPPTGPPRSGRGAEAGVGNATGGGTVSRPGRPTPTRTPPSGPHPRAENEGAEPPAPEGARPNPPHPPDGATSAGRGDQPPTVPPPAPPRGRRTPETAAASPPPSAHQQPPATRRDGGSESSAGENVSVGSTGAHTQGTSVVDLLAAYGEAGETRRRRRREE